MVDEESLVRPDKALAEDAGYLQSMIAQARQLHAQLVLSAPRKSSSSHGASEMVATVTLPTKLVDFILEVAKNLSQGRAVALITFNPMLTTHQAARVLGVSRPHLVKLLEQGEMKFEKVGTHRRVHLEEVLRYKAKRDGSRRAALDEITQISHEAAMDYMGEDFEVIPVPKRDR